jgi:hypothetical protein
MKYLIPIIQDFKKTSKLIKHGLVISFIGLTFSIATLLIKPTPIRITTFIILTFCFWYWIGEFVDYKRKHE